MEFLPHKIDGNNVYVGMWKRFLAACIDMLCMLPIAALVFFIQSWGMQAALVITVISSMVFVVYSIVFHYKYGATLGKFALGIRVTRPNGYKINLHQALLRSSVDFLFAVLILIAQVIAISAANPDVFLNLGFLERAKYTNSLNPGWYAIVNAVSQIWFLSQFLVVLLNKRKRAIHDFIAGTVVIKKEYVEQF